MDSIVPIRNQFDNEADEDCNLRTFECTCWKFSNELVHAPVGSLKRLCKHLMAASAAHNLLESSDSSLLPLLPMFKTGSVHPQPNGPTIVCDPIFSRCATPSGNVVYFAHSVASPWIDVMARKHRKKDLPGTSSGEYELYGWDTTDGEWARGESPYGVRELRPFLHDVGLMRAHDLANLDAGFLQRITELELTRMRADTAVAVLASGIPMNERAACRLCGCEVPHRKSSDHTFIFEGKTVHSTVEYKCTACSSRPGHEFMNLVLRGQRTPKEMREWRLNGRIPRKE